MAHGDYGHFVVSRLHANGATSSCGVKRLLAGNASWDQPVSWTHFRNNSNYGCYLRKEKRGPDITCSWKDSKGNPWIEICRCTAPRGMFGKEVFPVNGFNGANPAQFIFSEIELKAIDAPLIIFIRYPLENQSMPSPRWRLSQSAQRARWRSDWERLLPAGGE